MSDNLHQLRCFGYGARISGAEARPDFRCAVRGDLFEVEYPGWGQLRGHHHPNPGALKWLWRECAPQAAVDQLRGRLTAYMYQAACGSHSSVHRQSSSLPVTE